MQRCFCRGVSSTQRAGRKSTSITRGPITTESPSTSTRRFEGAAPSTTTKAVDGGNLEPEPLPGPNPGLEPAQGDNARPSQFDDRLDHHSTTSPVPMLRLPQQEVRTCASLITSTSHGGHAVRHRRRPGRRRRPATAGLVGNRGQHVGRRRPAWRDREYASSLLEHPDLVSAAHRARQAGS